MTGLTPSFECGRSGVREFDSAGFVEGAARGLRSVYLVLNDQDPGLCLRRL
jgi:hypothetical protein